MKAVVGVSAREIVFLSLCCSVVSFVHFKLSCWNDDCAIHRHNVLGFHSEYILCFCELL